MEFTIDSTIRLNNGVKIPIIGFGTWTLRGKIGYQAISCALEAGYRHIDTAKAYKNEKIVGQVVKDSGISREKVFITSKVRNKDQGFNKTLSAFKKSLKDLGTNYLDLYLIHWPIDRLRNETWKALVKLYNEEKVRAIGVSNFTINHLSELLEKSSNIPSINQIEFSPFLYQKKLLEYCKTSEIVIEAHCPLTRATKLSHPVLIEISRKYNKSPAQILIRWGLQHNLIVLPRSSNKEHIYENIGVFDFSLNHQDIAILNNLNENYRVSHDPTNVK